nr:DUF3488 and transglutaminase-like domain-containing protein [Mariprofundus sp. NF]
MVCCWRSAMIADLRHDAALLRAERLTLAVLLCGVAALALSDFVSPFYWLLSAVAATLRLWRGPSLHLSELQASIVGWLGFCWVIVELVFGRELIVAFTDFLLILSFAIVVEAATPRNHLHRMLVGLFLVLAAAVLTDSVLYVIPLLLMMWFLWRAAACLYSLNWPGGDLPAVPMRQEGRWMVLMVAVTALLFITLPRFEFHSLLKATQPRLQTSGFSDLVQLGDFARTLDSRVIMRVEPLDDSADGIKQFRRWTMGRYWRGAVLSRFTGHGWQKISARRQSQIAAGEDLVVADGGSFKVAMYREASDHAYIQLPSGLLGIRDLPEAIRIDGAAAVQFIRAPARRLRLLMDVASSAEADGMAGPLRREHERDKIPTELRQWLDSFVASGEAPEVALERIARELRGWEYDLNTPLDASRPIASFLQLKSGHCELYATTLALAARELGFASRVVNGYLGGDWNEVGNFLQIRELHAHSWSEVWLAGSWKRIDATPSVRDGLLHIRFPTLDQLWESAKLGWYRYVLEFQNSDRLNFLKSLWQSVRLYSNWLLSAALAIGLMLLMWRSAAQLRIRLRRPKRELLCSELDRWLHRRGVQRRPYQPLRDTALPEGVAAEQWQGFVQQWESACYGRGKLWNRHDLQRHLRALLKSY